MNPNQRIIKTGTMATPWKLVTCRSVFWRNTIFRLRERLTETSFRNLACHSCGTKCKKLLWFSTMAYLGHDVHSYKSRDKIGLGRKYESLQKEEMLDESQNFIQGDHWGGGGGFKIFTDHYNNHRAWITNKQPVFLSNHSIRKKKPICKNWWDSNDIPQYKPSA